MGLFGRLLTGAATSNARNAIRNTPEGAAFFAAVESFGYYDDTAMKKEIAESVYRVLNNFGGSSANDIKQRQLYWSTLKKRRLYIPLAAAYAISVYADPIQLGINVNSKVWKENRTAFGVCFPNIPQFLVEEGVKFRDYDKVLSCMSYFIDLHFTIFMEM
jgi:hypothetical protein